MEDWAGDDYIHRFRIRVIYYIALYNVSCRGKAELTCSAPW